MSQTATLNAETDRPTRQDDDEGTSRRVMSARRVGPSVQLSFSTANVTGRHGTTRINRPTGRRLTNRHVGQLGPSSRPMLARVSRYPTLSARPVRRHESRRRAVMSAVNNVTSADVGSCRPVISGRYVVMLCLYTNEQQLVTGQNK